IAATAVVPPGAGTGACGTGRVVRIVVAEAVGARTGRIGRPATWREIHSPPLMAWPENPRSTSWIAHQVDARQFDHARKDDIRLRRYRIRDQRADRGPFESPLSGIRDRGVGVARRQLGGAGVQQIGTTTV